MKKFLTDRSGNFAIMAAIVMVPILAAVGLSIDYTNALRVRNEMQQAADAAALAAASTQGLSDTQLKKLADKVFNTNFTSDDAGRKFKGSLKILKNGYRYSASGEVRSIFMELIGRKYSNVDVLAEVGKTKKDLEIALVLDTTGSMGPYVDKMKAAAKDLVDTLFKSSSGSVKVAVVPFVASVNVGKFLRSSEIDRAGDSKYNASSLEHKNDFLETSGSCGSPRPPDGPSTKEGALLDTISHMFARAANELFSVKKAYAASGAYIGMFPTGWTSTGPCSYYSPDHLSNWDLYKQIGIGWKGCVEARPGDLDVSDDPARKSDPDSQWVPYFWPDEEARGDPAVAHNHYFDGDYSDLRPTTEVNHYNFGPTNDPIKYDGRFSFTIDETAPDTLGPNKSCPDEVLPLESSKKTIKDKIDSLNTWNDGGTIASEGIAWAMRMLTPEPPFTEAQPASDDVKKILILFGDGSNSMPVNIDNSPMVTDYGAYGYAGNGHLRTPVNYMADALATPSGPDRVAKIEKATQSFLDNRMRAACQNAKDKSISVMTILFNEKDTKTQALYRDCASDADQALLANDTVSMQKAFDSIAAQILQVYLRK